MKPRGRANGKPFVILIADDDPDDRMLVNDAFAETRPHIELGFVVTANNCSATCTAAANLANGRADPTQT